MHMLNLTKIELALFNALPADVRDGWKVVEETLTFEDTDYRRHMRLSVMKLHDPRLVALRGKLMELKDDPKKAKQVLDELDISTVNDDDMLQLFYGMGPDPITFMIINLLQPGADDESVKMASALSIIRHVILLAFVEAYSSPSYT